MRSGSRILVFVGALVAAGGLALWTGVLDSPVSTPAATDAPPEAVQLFPAPEDWPAVHWNWTATGTAVWIGTPDG